MQYNKFWSPCYTLHPHDLLITGILYLLVILTNFFLSTWSVSVNLFLFFNLFSASMYKWDDDIWLISLSIVTAKSTHVFSNGKISFLLLLNSIPLCDIYIYLSHIFLIHLSKDVGYVHILAAISKDALNMGVHISFWFSASVRYLSK